MYIVHIISMLGATRADSIGQTRDSAPISCVFSSVEDGGSTQKQANRGTRRSTRWPWCRLSAAPVNQRIKYVYTSKLLTQKDKQKHWWVQTPCKQTVGSQDIKITNSRPAYNQHTPSAQYPLRMEAVTMPKV